MRALAILLVAAPAVSMAVIPSASFATFEVRSDSQAEVLVRGDSRSYHRVESDRPLRFEVTGPGELRVTLRQVLSPSQVPGRTTTNVSLLSNERLVEHSFQLRGANLDQIIGSRGAERANQTVTHELTVLAGPRRYQVRIETAGHRVLAAIEFGPSPSNGEDTFLIPLAALAAPTSIDRSDDALGALDEIPLAPLVAPTPSGVRDEEPSSEQPSSSESMATAAREDAVSSYEPSPALIGRPLVDVAALERPTRMLLGVRGLAVATGLGGGTFGGGLDLHLRTSLLSGRLSAGVSADVFAYRLLVSYLQHTSLHQHESGMAHLNLTIQSVPVMLSAAYDLALGSTMGWMFSAGCGPIVTIVRDGMETTSFAPGLMVSTGPTLSLGRTTFRLAARVNHGFGSVLNQNGTRLNAGPLAGAGITAGISFPL